MSTTKITGTDFSADFPCRDPAISSFRSFYGQNICSVSINKTAKYELEKKLKANIIIMLIQA